MYICYAYFMKDNVWHMSHVFFASFSFFVKMNKTDWYAFSGVFPPLFYLVTLYLALAPFIQIELDT